jgi:tetratricopeptide (TPR) repeat protein
VFGTHWHCLTAAVLCAVSATRAFSQTADFQEKLKQASALRGQGHYAEAEPLLRSLLEETRRHEGEGVSMAIVSDYLGRNSHDLGDYAEAERIFTKALSILKKLDQSDSPDATTIHMHLAELYWEENRAREAEILLRKVVTAREREATATPADVAAARIDLALACSSQGRKREAEELLRAALPAIEQMFGPDSPMLLSVLDPLASVLSALHQYSEALTYSERAWRIIQKSPQIAGPDRVNTTITLSTLYAATGQVKEAMYFAKEGLALVEAAYQPDHPRVGWYLKSYASVLRRLHHKEEARAAERRSEAILASGGGRARQTVNVSALR